MIETKFSKIIDLTTDFLRMREAEGCSSIERGLSMLNGFRKVKERFIEKDDLSFNLLLELLSPNENDNSRILGRLFQMRRDGHYFILQSFVDKFFGDSFRGVIRRPEVEFETHRIDILVKEEGSYAIILENKIWNAPQQNNQLARYIQSLKNDGFEDEQIYVVYLPQTQNYKPSKCNWMRPSSELCANCSDNTRCNRTDEENNLWPIYEERFRCVSFSSEILSWLREYILPMLNDGTQILMSALIQYVNFLESRIGLQQTENFKMEVEKMIREKLCLTGDSSADFNIVSDQIKDINELLKYLKGMLDELESETYEKLEASLKVAYPDHVVFSDKHGIWHYIYVTLKCRNHDLKMRVFSAYDSSRKVFYYGIMPDGENKKGEKPELMEILKDSVKLHKSFMPGDLWICYKSSSPTDIEQNMKDLIEQLNVVAE